MSYETTLLVTKVYEHGGGNKMIVAIDLAACGDLGTPVGKLLHQCRADESLQRQVYLPTSNKPVPTDDNGHMITAVPLNEMVLALRKQNRRDTYRRFDLALAVLDQFIAPNAEKWSDEAIEILQFGH